MTKLSPSQWGKLWIEEGGRRDKVAEAVATLMCESGGDTDATSSVGARGAWQFMPETLHSERCARDPRCSTREAVKLSNRGEDFSAWDCNPDSVARSGTSTGDATFADYLEQFEGGGLTIPGTPIPNPAHIGKQLGEAAKGIANAHIPGISDAAEALERIAAFMQGLGELLLTPEGWLRIGKLVGGAILLLWGLRVVIRESTGVDAVNTGKNTATKVAEAASLAAIVK